MSGRSDKFPDHEGTTFSAGPVPSRREPFDDIDNEDADLSLTNALLADDPLHEENSSTP